MSFKRFPWAVRSRKAPTRRLVKSSKACHSVPTSRFLGANMRFLLRMAAVATLLMPLAALAGEQVALDVQHVMLVKGGDVLGQVAMQLELTAQSGSAFADFTGRHVGETVELCVDEAPVMSPRLVEPILGAKIMVSGNFSVGELEGMARKIADKQAKVSVRALGE